MVRLLIGFVGVVLVTFLLGGCVLPARCQVWSDRVMSLVVQLVLFQYHTLRRPEPVSTGQRHLASWSHDMETTIPWWAGLTPHAVSNGPDYPPMPDAGK